MSILNHNIFDNVRTRVIVLHEGNILLLPPGSDSEDCWRVPGGGMEPHESLADCAAREVFEETGLRIKVGRVVFLREWVVPDYCSIPAGPGEYGFGIEVFVYAAPLELSPLRAEEGGLLPSWMPLGEVPSLPIWPNELKSLAVLLAAGQAPAGINSFVSEIEDPALPPKMVAW